MSPLCESYLPAEQLDAVEPFYPLHVRICEECLLVQLEEYVPGERDLHRLRLLLVVLGLLGRPRARATWSSMVERFGLDARQPRRRAGQNDGYLLQHFVERGIPALGIEPAANVAEAARERGVETIVDFFGSRARATRSSTRAAAPT